MIEVDAAGKRAVLRDLNSLNGCFVNNVRIKGQREALSHGDNVRFGFDTRIWTVDCGSEKTRQRKSSSGDWEFGCGGAAQSHAPAQPPVREPPRLSSGGMPLPAFFDGAPGVGHPSSPQPPQRMAMAPSPPEDEMRTFESDVFGGGGQEEQEERARRRASRRSRRRTPDRRRGARR